MSYMSAISSALGGFTSNIMSIATANQRAKAIQARYETQAKLAQYNQTIAENQAIAERQNAKAAEQRAQARKGQQHAENVALREKQLAIMAKSGVLAQGTPILVQEDQLAEMKLRENDILYSGALEKRQHNINASYSDAVARMAQYQGQVALATGKYKADMIQFQKKLTIAKMFYDPSNATSFGEVDNQQQFQHFDTGTLSNIGSGSSAQASQGGNYSYANNPQGSTTYNPKAQGIGSNGGYSFQSTDTSLWLK